MSKIDDVARGLLVDAMISFAAICREKGYGLQGPEVWAEELIDMHRRITGGEWLRESAINTAMFMEVDDEHVEMLIEERRGLIRDTMQEEMADLETASPPPENTEGIRDERQG